MHTGNGFLLVYSVIDDQTLEELKSIREQILRVYKGKKVIAYFLKKKSFYVLKNVPIPILAANGSDWK